MEWIIFDDGPDSVQDIFTGPLTKGIPNLRYIREEPTESAPKLSIGAKRNRLRVEAKGDICVCMDDDDWYSSERVSHVVTKFAQYPKIQLAGASEMYFYFHRLGAIYRFEPIHPNHSTHGCLAWRRDYGLTHKYDETVGFAEEPSFLDEYKNPMIQLDPMKTILVFCHSLNTFDKYAMIDTNPRLVRSQMKLKQFVPTAAQRKLVADLLDQVDLPRPAAKAEAEAETEANSLKDTATQE
jgi:glycosyltransferase involved in cell wall biosynthesis